MYIFSSLILYKKIFWFFISSINGCKLALLQSFAEDNFATTFCYFYSYKDNILCIRCEIFDKK